MYFYYRGEKWEKELARPLHSIRLLVYVHFFKKVSFRLCAMFHCHLMHVANYGWTAIHAGTLSLKSN